MDVAPLGALDRPDIAVQFRIRAFETDLCDARFAGVVRCRDQAQIAEFLRQEGEVGHV